MSDIRNCPRNLLWRYSIEYTEKGEKEKKERNPNAIRDYYPFSLFNSDPFFETKKLHYVNIFKSCLAVCFTYILIPVVIILISNNIQGTCVFIPFLLALTF
jgi:hypothetical protein